jgi:putative redox protein
MSLTASAHSVPGTLRQEVLIDGRHRLITDEPESVGGDGSAAAPHELLPAALAACVSTTLVMYARTKEWELDGVDVDVVYDPRSTPRRFEVDIRLTGNLSAEQLVRLEKVAATCPVRRAVESGSEFVERIELRAADRPDRDPAAHFAGAS